MCKFCDIIADRRKKDILYFGNPPGEPLRNQPFTHRNLSENQLKRIKDELKKIGVARG